MNVRDKCGLRPLAFHTRHTIDLSMPKVAASERPLQCVAFGGRVCVVVSMIFRTAASRCRGLRPPRGRSYSMSDSPPAANRPRQRTTVLGMMPSSAAMSLFILPSAARNTIVGQMATQDAVTAEKVPELLRKARKLSANQWDDLIAFANRLSRKKS